MRLFAPALVVAQDTPGFQFLGFGYDLLKGNPCPTDGSGDSGIRTNVFQFTDTQGQKTPDGKWNVPDKTTSQMLSSCSLDQEQSEIYSAYDYQQGLSVGFSVDVGYDGLQFTLGMEFGTVKAKTEEHDSIYAQVTSVCAAYDLTMHMFDHPDVDPNFAAGVDSLPADYDEGAYMTFLSRFGTHVITSLMAGGRWGWQMSFEWNRYVSMLDDHINVEAGIKYAGEVNAGFSLNSSADTRSMAAVVHSISANSSFSVGGDLVPDVTKWMASVKEDPAPVHMTLTSVAHFLTPSFVNSSDLQQKQTNMEKAVKGYCPFLAKYDPNINCTAPQPVDPPGPRPVQRTAVRYLCVSNHGGFRMSFDVEDVDATSSVSAPSGSFDAGQTQCVDAGATGAAEGDHLRCHVSVVAGAGQDCGKADITYDKRSKKRAYFSCKGATFSYSCPFLGAGEGVEAGQAVLI